MATAQDQISGALRLLGQLAAGEEATADDLDVGLEALNQMLDSWSTEQLSVYSVEDQVFTWTANFTMRTIGPTGDFVGTRPVIVDPSTFYKVNNISYPLAIINRDQYYGIALKSATSTMPQALFCNPTMPDTELYVYPVPSSSFELHLISWVALTEPATLATTIVVPPGYLRAYRYNLAVEVASEFGIDVPPKVSRIAELSKRTIKRINNPNLLMSVPYSLIGRRRNDFNIFSGLPQ